MTFSLLTDEHISPSLVPRLWQVGCDTVAVRDRNMLSASDPVIWQYALRERRTVVTINEGHFVRLARKEAAHPGLIIIPDGGSRDEQFDYITAATTYAVTVRLFPPSFRNCTARVDEACAVSWAQYCSAGSAFDVTSMPVSNAKN